jgi:hypothetical protein
MIKHTPGPWTAIADPYEDGKPYYHIRAGHGSHGDGFSFSGIIPDADARLIAAAPELLAALESTTKMLSFFLRYTTPDWDGSATPTSTIGVARATIAKAKGE